ncbi:hypothetical protein NLI96_g3862 [Meripilus lineatus]|uniref:Major facilitator superfamily (MFS) profile domain-containing protein n=1 Tax=Meripilus lineatus TaxID=2056292 RepID=A0AAD5YIK1_9APHY|nr:hypothetical protein NLI96_g3862 [Physisporinus lineatus]
MSIPPSTPNPWRSRALAVLPLVFLEALASDFADFPLYRLLQDIECEKYFSKEACGIPEVTEVASRNLTICAGVAITIGILVSGLYSRVLDYGGRRKAMGVAASLQLLGAILGFLSASRDNFRKISAFIIVSLIRGLGGGTTVLKAANLVLMTDCSSSTSRSFYFTLTFGMIALSGFIVPLVGHSLLVNESYSAAYLISLLCWVVYLLYLGFVFREVQDVKLSMLSGTSWTLGTPIKYSVDPLKLLFNEYRHIIPWICAVIFALPFPEILITAYAARLFIVDFNTDSDFGTSGEAPVVASAVASITSMFVLLPATAYLYRFRYGRKLVSADATERKLASDTDTQHNEPCGATQSHSGSQLSATLLAISQDLSISRACFVAITIGALIVSFSERMAVLAVGYSIYSLGRPSKPVIQSLVSHIAKPNQRGRIITSLVAFESVASVLLFPSSGILSFFEGPPDHPEDMLPPIPSMIPAAAHTATLLYLLCTSIMFRMGTAAYTGIKTD